MAKTYLWKTSTRFQSDTSLSYGVDPTTYENWQSAEAGSQTLPAITYWYRDANVAGPGGFTDANSNRVAISISESWTATIDNRNNLTVTITTTLNSVVRDDLRGSNQDSPGRNINIYREQGASAVLALTDTLAGTAHTIWSGPITLAQYTFTLAPGQSAERSSLYVHNQTIGSSSYDDIWAGVQFQNPLPADYRPGERKVSGTWYSHNRTGGMCHRKVNGSWVEMRTLDGAVGTGNPPSRKTNGTWYNQMLLGAGG